MQELVVQIPNLKKDEYKLKAPSDIEDSCWKGLYIYQILKDIKLEITSSFCGQSPRQYTAFCPYYIREMIFRQVKKVESK